MDIDIDIYMDIDIDIYMDIDIDIYTDMDIDIYMDIYMDIDIDIYTDMDIDIYMDIYMDIDIDIYMNIDIDIYMDIHGHIHIITCKYTYAYMNMYIVNAKCKQRPCFEVVEFCSGMTWSTAENHGLSWSPRRARYTLAWLEKDAVVTVNGP